MNRKMRVAPVTGVLAMIGIALLGPSYALDAEYAPANAQGQYRYLIEFAEPGLLRQTERAFVGKRFDSDVPETRVARDMLMARQAEYRQVIGQTLGRTVDVSHYYLITHSGMAAWLKLAEAEAVAQMEGVVSVERERVYQLTTFLGPRFIGADTLWDGTNAPDGSELRGDGMVIAILDTGIDPNHPSFANDPACGHGEGGVSDKLISFLDCAGTDESGLCNGGNPVDSHGHGSHTSSTAGGNTLDQTADPSPDFDISGVAPCAHIRSYKVCPTNTCTSAAVQAGMNSILLHGDVDVMNFSISGGTNPWSDNDRRKLDLVDAGVMVAAAAGNTSSSQPNPVGQVGHLGPWVMTVAASTRDDPTGLFSITGPGEPPPETQNVSGGRGSGSPFGEPLNDHPVRRFSEQPEQSEGCTPGEDGVPGSMAPFPEDFFAGAVALIQRGTCSFTVKINNAFDAGADLVIIRNNEPGNISMGTPGQAPIPAWWIDQTAGDVVRDFVDANPDTATIDFEVVPGQGDILAGFSLRGPTSAPLQHLTKPDVTAPGVSIYAATPNGYGTSSGTSMSSPHVAGAAALVRQAQPGWTVPEVKSALMMTAFKGGTKEDGKTAWDWDDVGSGRVDLTKAARAGLVMHETVDNFLAADPDSGGDVRTLNLPAVRDVDCTPNCTWTRTVRNTLNEPSNWTISGHADDAVILVSPSSFSFSGNPGETQELTIMAWPVGDQTAAVVFGEVVFTEISGLAPEQHITVSVRGEGQVGPVLNVNLDGVQVTLEPGEAFAQSLVISNPGTEELTWSIEGGGIAGMLSGEYLPMLDESFDLPDFELIAPVNGGEPVVFTIPAGVATRGDVVGFSFSGTAAGISGAFSWASDTCLIVEAPDGSTYGVGGPSAGSTGTPGCGMVNAWDFQGVGSADNGSFQSQHEDAFDPGAGDAGEWTFTFINDWNDANAATIAWTDVTLTLHKAPPSVVCEEPDDVDWLSVAPENGVTPPITSDSVTLVIESNDLNVGTHFAALCVASNDVNGGLAIVPVMLTVEETEPPLDAIFRDRFEVEGQ